MRQSRGALPTLLAAAALLLAALALVSCGGTEEDTSQLATATPEESGTPQATLKPASYSPSPLPATNATERYLDPISKFTFEYPGSWFVSGPPADPAILGYSVTLTSYDLKGAPEIGVAPPPDQLKIDIGVDPNPDKLSVETWISERTAGPGEGVSVFSESETLVAGERAMKRSVSVDGTNVLEYFFAHGDKMYFVAAYTAESTLISVLDDVISSFAFGP